MLPEVCDVFFEQDIVFGQEFTFVLILEMLMLKMTIGRRQVVMGL